MADIADTNVHADRQTDGTSDNRDRVARGVAETLTRIAREATRIAQEGQAIAEEATRAATEGQIAAEVVKGIAEQALHLAEARQHLAEEAQRLAEDAQQVSEKNQKVAEEAERATATSLRLRTETLTNVTHDLRTPLTSIVGRVDLARKRLARGTDLNPDRAWLFAQLDAVRAAVTRLHGATDELDDVAHLITRQESELVRASVDVVALVRSVAQEFALQRPVVVEAPDALVLVQGDRVHLDRMLQNLVGNAIKYSSPAAPVAVAVTRGDADAVIDVQDRGVGIPVAELPRVFERYYRAATAHGVAGSGIGLSGAKEIVEQHGGTIAVESVEGVGTTVTVILPLAPDEGA